MADKTVISAGTTLRGLVRGGGHLTIDGSVFGEIDLTGDVLIGEGALVKASVRATRIVVRGAISGDLYATDSVSLEDGARDEQNDDDGDGESHQLKDDAQSTPG